MLRGEQEEAGAPGGGAAGGERPGCESPRVRGNRMKLRLWNEMEALRFHHTHTHTHCVVALTTIG